MKPKELKEYIVEHNRTIDILESIGMHSVEDKGEYISCAFPDGDNVTGCLIYQSLYIRPHTRKIENKNGYHPDIFDLIEFVIEKPSIPYVMNFLGLSDGTIDNKPKIKDGLDIFRKVKKRKSTKKEANPIPEAIIDRYSDTCHISLVKDGILPSSAKVWQLGLDMETDRITFVHRHWYTGKILAIIGRTIISSWKELNINKYMLIAGKGYLKSENLYGVYENMKSIKESRKLIVVEGEKSVIKLWQYGYKNACSVGCHEISDNQIGIISMLGIDEVTVCWDSDVDTEHTLDTCKKLNSVCSKVSYIDVSKIKVFQDKCSPCDKGIRKWKLLYSHRKDYIEE